MTLGTDLFYFLQAVLPEFLIALRALEDSYAILLLYNGFTRDTFGVPQTLGKLTM
jgi:hypothetical protein